MKKEFSNKWKASRQPRKQRKYRSNAPIHMKRRMISSNLSKELRKKYGKRSFNLRKGDSVRVMRGEFKGKKGKILSIDMKKLIVSIEGIQRTKKDGTKIDVIFDPSNLQIFELNLDDSKRKINKKEETSEKKTGKTDEKKADKENKIVKKENK